MWDLPQQPKKTGMDRAPWRNAADTLFCWGIQKYSAAYEGACMDGPRSLLAANLLDQSGEVL